MIVFRIAKETPFDVFLRCITDERHIADLSECVARREVALERDDPWACNAEVDRLSRLRIVGPMPRVIVTVLGKEFLF